MPLLRLYRSPNVVTDAPANSCYLFHTRFESPWIWCTLRRFVCCDAFLRRRNTHHCFIWTSRLDQHLTCSLQRGQYIMCMPSRAIPFPCDTFMFSFALGGLPTPPLSTRHLPLPLYRGNTVPLGATGSRVQGLRPHHCQRHRNHHQPGLSCTRSRT